MKSIINTAWLIIITMLLIVPIQSRAQAILNEDFENGGTIPNGWTQGYVNGTIDWSFENGGATGDDPSSAYEGSYNACFYDGSYNDYATKLITPLMNLDIYSTATLTFYLYMADWAGDQDVLNVYYKNGAEGNWTQLQTWDTSIESWTKQTVSLPDLTADYYLAFEGVARYGYGVCIDSVTVTASGASGVSADFSADVTSGTFPLTVSFTDQSLGSPTSWNWDFGDGNTSTDQHPTHTYQSEGTYTVSLTVSDGTDSNTETKTGYITVTAPLPLAADFTADFTSGSEPLTVNFSDLSTGNPTSWNWDFGDGNTSTSQNPMHTYQSTGTYTVSLTVSDGTDNSTETKDDYITVTAYTPPIQGEWTWQNPQTQGITIYAAQFITADIGFSVGEDGLFMKTQDGGNNWSVMETGETLDFNGLFFLDANTGFIVGNSGTILTTTDGGQTFTSTSISYNVLKDVYFIDSNTGFVVGSNGIFYQTTDAGSNWTAVTHPAGSDDLNDIDFIDITTGYVFGGHWSSSATILKTTDGGTSWSAASLPITYELYTGYFLDASVGFAGGNYGRMVRTTDGGASWQEIGRTVYDDIQGIYFSDAENGVLACANNCYISHDGGSNWTNTFENDDYYPNTMSFPNISTGYVFGSGGHILKTEDDGNSWSMPFSSTLHSLNAIDFANDNQAIAVGDKGTAIYTDNGGQSWTALSTGEDYYDFEDIAYVEANTAYATSSYGNIYKTTDAGASWSQISTSASSTLYGVFGLSADEIIAVGYSGDITRTTDGGATWSDISIAYDKYLYDACFFNSDNGIVVGGYSNISKIYKTSDGGTSWTEITAPADERLRSVTFLNSAIGLAVGDDGTILKTDDGGASWTDKSVSNSWDFYAVVFQTVDNGYAIGTGGIAYETTDGGETWSEMDMPVDRYFYSAAIAANNLYLAGMYGSVIKFGEDVEPTITADFSAAPLTGTAPLSVDFSDLSTGPITSWNWDFGDGNSSTEQNPTHTYQSAGNYTVTLQVSDGTNNATETKTDYISVEPAQELTADFEADATSGEVPLIVNFTDLSAGTPTTWNWDFGDGSSSAEQHPSHTYQSAGNYTVSLTVSDGTENSTETKENYIVVTEPTEPVENNWTWQHPRPQGNHLYEAYFINESVGYAGGSHGTLIKTSDGGASWDILNIDTISAVHGIHFLDQNVGFITGYGLSTNNGFIRKTTDGGNSWSDLEAPTNDDYNDIFFMDENSGIIVGDYGLILKTTDGGTSWNEMTSNTSESLLDVFFIHSSLGFAVGTDGAVIKTTDGGNSWSAATYGTDDLNKIYFPTENIGYIVGDYGTLYRTFDEGNTWNLCPNSESLYASFFDVYFRDENSGLAVGDGYIYKTVDGGENWVQKYSNWKLDQKAIVPMGTDNYLVFGESGLIMQSDDGGENWSLPYGENYDELTAIDFANELVGYAVADGDNILKTVDGGNSWTPLDFDEYLNDILAIDVNTVIAVGSDGEVYKTINGGQDWSENGVGGYDDLYALSEPAGNTLYAVGQDTLIIKSTDLGDSWIKLASPTTEEYNFRDVFFHDENSGIILGGTSSAPHIFKTTDGGASWTEVTSPVQEFLSAVEFVSPSIGFIAGDDGTIMKTTDGGASWTLQTVDIPSSYIVDDFEDIAFLNENTGFVVGDKGLVFQTVNGGNTWTFIENVTYNYLNDICLENGLAYIAGWEGTILTYDIDAAPVLAADFTADVTAGVAPLTVQFTDQSSGSPNSWSWDFGDGNSSTDQNPTHTYQDTGIYTVALTVSDGTNSSTMTATDLITVFSYEDRMISLVPGWNWFSLNVEQPDMSIDNVLSSLGDSAQTIKAQESFALYDESSGWSGALDSLPVESMFMIKMDQAATLNFAGIPVDYSSRSLPLDAGWNWISYLPDQSTGMDEALSGIAGQAEFIKNQYGFSFYYEDLGWYGLLDTMFPGDGYKIKIDTACDLTYTVADASPNLAQSTSAKKSYNPAKLYSAWNLNPHDYAMSMAVTGMITDDLELTDDDVVIACTQNEIRGVTRIREFLLTGQKIFSLLVYGREANEDIQLRLYRSETEAYFLASPLNFTSDAILGNGLEPLEFTLSTTGLSNADLIPADYTLNQNYPNPFNPLTTIRFGLPEEGKVKIVIYNLQGRQIARLVNARRSAGWYQLLWNGTDFNGRLVSSGVYICRIDVRGKTETYSNQIKMLFMK